MAVLLGGRASSAPPVRASAAIDTWRTIPSARVRYLTFLDSSWAPARPIVAKTGDTVGVRAVVLDRTEGDRVGWDVVLRTTYRGGATWARREQFFAPVLARRGAIQVDGKGPRELVALVWAADGTNIRERSP